MRPKVNKCVHRLSQTLTAVEISELLPSGYPAGLSSCLRNGGCRHSITGWLR